MAFASFLLELAQFCSQSLVLLFKLRDKIRLFGFMMFRACKHLSCWSQFGHVNLRLDVCGLIHWLISQIACLSD